MPFRGTLWPDPLAELHWITENLAIFYLQMDETVALVRVLAVFFGGQDHRMKVLSRRFALDRRPGNSLAELGKMAQRMTAARPSGHMELSDRRTELTRFGHNGGCGTRR